jgi:hypothetical protein
MEGSNNTRQFAHFVCRTLASSRRCALRYAENREFFMDEELTEISTQTDTETILGFLLIIANAVLSYHVATERLGSAEVFGFWLARVVFMPAIVVFLFSVCVKNATARKKWAVMMATQFAIILANIGAMI